LWWKLSSVSKRIPDYYLLLSVLWCLALLSIFLFRLSNSILSQISDVSLRQASRSVMISLHVPRAALCLRMSFKVSFYLRSRCWTLLEPSMEYSMEKCLHGPLIWHKCKVNHPNNKHNIILYYHIFLLRWKISSVVHVTLICNSKRETLKVQARKRDSNINICYYSWTALSIIIIIIHQLNGCIMPNGSL